MHSYIQGLGLIGREQCNWISKAMSGCSHFKFYYSRFSYTQFWKIFICVCVCTCLCVCTCVHACLHVEAAFLYHFYFTCPDVNQAGVYWWSLCFLSSAPSTVMYPHNELLHSFLDKVSCWTWSSPLLPHWPASSRDLIASTPSIGFADVHHCTWLLHEF